MATASEQFICPTHTPLPVQDRSGRSYCYNCIIESHQTQAYNLARRLLNDWALAEDAVQESFVSGYRAFSQFRGENLKAWVMRIVANTCRDMLRSRRARPAVSLDPLPAAADDPTPSAVDLPSSLESPEDYAERNELRHTIERGLAALSQERRLAVLLVDVQGMSYEEAAQIMDCSLGTVKSRISRARAELRDFLQGTGELLPSQFRQDR
jgi:RNA polymerase sigma-70 factor (ECF subfamily)